MVQATVDNQPVSVTLNTGESTTVPSGEVWRVTLTLGVENTSYATRVHAKVNGTTTMNCYEKDANMQGDNTVVSETVLTGGDTIKCTGEAGGLHVGGFVVN